jgi:hypothetical protein
MKLITLDNAVVINRPVEEVFKFVANVDNLPRWMGWPTKKVTDAPFGEGTLFWLDRMLLRIHDFHANEGFDSDSVYFRGTSKFFLARTHGELRFEAMGRETRFRFKRFVTPAVLLKPFARRFAKYSNSELQAALQKLRSLLEQS